MEQFKDMEQFRDNERFRDKGAERFRLQVLRAMTPEQRLLQALQLSEWTRQIFRQGLRHAHPDLPEEEFQRLYLRRIALCHNRNY